MNAIDDIARETGIEAARLILWVEREWILPAGAAPNGALDVARALLIRDLQSDLGVNDEGIGIALHLLDQIHGLRGALAEARKALERDRRV